MPVPCALHLHSWACGFLTTAPHSCAALPLCPPPVPTPLSCSLPHPDLIVSSVTVVSGDARFLRKPRGDFVSDTVSNGDCRAVTKGLNLHTSPFTASQWEVAYSGSATEYVFTHLKPGTLYKLRACCISTGGHSQVGLSV